MATLTIFPGGSSAGFAGSGRTKNDGGKVRGEVKGWTAGSARRLTAWLWSVDSSKLEQGGWSVTLTAGATPATSDEWHRARVNLLKRLRRAGITQVQWLTEWTAKGRPHMHMAAFLGHFDEYGTERTRAARDLQRIIVPAWLDVCDSMGWPASTRGQHVVPMTDEEGWLKYLSKHASRGVGHYQRQGAPDGWAKTGRLWGVLGEWPTMEPVKVELDRAQFWRYRRLALRYQAAMMRQGGRAPKRRWQKARLGDREQGAYMGMSGWIPDTVSGSLVELALEVREEPRYHTWE